MSDEQEQRLCDRIAIPSAERPALLRPRLGIPFLFGNKAIPYLRFGFEIDSDWKIYLLYPISRLRAADSPSILGPAPQTHSIRRIQLLVSFANDMILVPHASFCLVTQKESVAIEYCMCMIR
jgi:hypothetical protein